MRDYTTTVPGTRAVGAAKAPSEPGHSHRSHHSCVGCGAYLSRYSDDARCSACARSGPIPDAVWADPAVAATLARWDFGVVFRLLRSATGMSQNDLSALTGLSQGAISQIEAGTRRLLNIDRIQAAIHALGVPAWASPFAAGTSARPSPPQR
ncbi:helix-turn-helix transcriptional regulator [Streptomyces sp. V4-01]|uniref:Helix-turn-helix transcriptional regulator n=1 Tax=Actinacidiphila polyblastidii TaxID=3110430 RepID=A0ABU7PDR4_9ACTN|nr:helix-turn-helix transcriptional regulator [Streptomyces sp. V4-01]